MKNNQIYWIIGIIILAVIILPKLDTESFSMFAIGDGETCVSNEPEHVLALSLYGQTRPVPEEMEQYKSKFSAWTIHGDSFNLCYIDGQTHKCWWGEPQTEATDLKMFLEVEFLEGVNGCNPSTSNCFSPKCEERLIERSDLFEFDTIRNGVNIYHYKNYPIHKIWCTNNNYYRIDTFYQEAIDLYFNTFYICETTECVSNEPDTLEGYEIVDATIYDCVTDDFDECYYEGCSIGQAQFSIGNSFYFVCPFPVFMDGPDIKVQNIDEYIGQYDNINQISVINGIKIYLQEGGMKLFESKNRLIMTNNPQSYFDTFFVCEEPKCYIYIAEVCQEVPCENYEVTYNTLEGCQEAIVGGCGTVTPGLENECCQNLGYDYWDETTLFCKSYEEGECLFTINEFCFKLWMLLVGLGAILLIYISTKK